jgi:hypothetical protein
MTTEPNEMEDLLNRFKRLAELADREPVRPFSAEEATKFVRQMFKLVAALQGECEILNLRVKRLESHRHQTGGVVVEPGTPSQRVEPDDEAKDPSD